MRPYGTGATGGGGEAQQAWLPSSSSSNSAPEDVPGFSVTVQNILGAGDAFGAGFLYGYVKEWDFWKAARLGNACGAIVVSRHGCSISMPFWEEVMAFVEEQGGETVSKNLVFDEPSLDAFCCPEASGIEVMKSIHLEEHFDLTEEWLPLLAVGASCVAP